jgi:TetR/AcrR family transcriptional regulator
VASAPKVDLEDSKTRLIEAAERLMREEGYAAVTSRRVASKAGLKPQLVHYYFRTMDDLFLAILEQGAGQDRVRLSPPTIVDGRPPGQRYVLFDL